MSRATLPLQDVTSGTRFVKGTCTHNCPDTCATVTEVRDGQAVGFRGRPGPPHHPRMAVREGASVSGLRLPP